MLVYPRPSFSRYALAPELSGRALLLPCRRRFWLAGAPRPLLRFHRSLRSRPPRVWRASADRCPPLAGVFIGWRQRANRSAVAIAPSSLRLPRWQRGRAPFILPCRAPCWAPSRLVAQQAHRPLGVALIAAGLLPPLRYCVGRRGSATDAPVAWLLALPHFPCPRRGCLASSASSGLSPLGRCRRFGSLAPALPAYVVIGSPARTAVADGSSLPTTARPSSHVTLPATDDGRGHVPSGHSRDSLRLPPPP